MPSPINVNADTQLELCLHSLAVAQKSLENYKRHPSHSGGLYDLSNAANQAEQAARCLNQLLGIRLGQSDLIDALDLGMIEVSTTNNDGSLSNKHRFHYREIELHHKIDWKTQAEFSKESLAEDFTLFKYYSPEVRHEIKVTVEKMDFA